MARVLPYVLLVAASSAAADPMITGQARIELGVRKSLHFLGENVLVDFCVVNADSSPITIQVGGDYRGSSRSLRFKVEVRDGKGVPLPDPDPNPINFGGLGYAPKIEPGKKWCQSLPLARYARIDAAGRYTITATHDLGWPAGKAPSGTAVITFAMPSATEAERVVATMEALPDAPNNAAGEVARNYADFSALRYDVYVAPLLARAKAGKLSALAGLAQIPTTNATRALVGLLGERDANVANEAARALALRLPDPALAGILPKRHPFEGSLTEQRKFLSQAWDPALADAVRAAARTRLASPDPAVQIDGAFMLEAVGTALDGPVLVGALDAAIARTATVPAEDNIYPTPRGACQELLRAAEMLVARKLASATTPKTPGELAIWLVALRAGAQPPGWEAELGRAFAHPNAYIRQIAMERAPDAVPPTLVPAIAANLAHADADVVVAAAELARRGKLVGLALDVAKAMRKGRGLRLNILGNAAAELGARYQRAQVLVDMLGDAATFDTALSELASMLDSPSRSSDGEASPVARAKVAAGWKRFVELHRTEIEAGKRFALTDPAVSSDLVPPNWHLLQPNGKPWP